MKRGSIVNDLGRVPGRLVLDDDDDEVPSIRRKMRLSNRNLTTVPKIAISTESLVLLDLSKNQLTILPNDITFESEHSVKQVFLQNNMLVSIPPEICRCQVLEDLRVSRNQLPHLPPALGKIHALIRLDASGNRISHTPPSLSQLMNLRVLNLSDNRIEHLDSMDILPLTGLTELSVAKNKLSEIPLAVAVLQHLRYLRLSHNKITELDSDMLRLPSLLELHLSDNLLRLLPERGWSQATNLDTLDLAGNVLTHVPRGLGLLTNLTVLGLTRNETLPKDLIETSLLGVEAVLKFIRPKKLSTGPQRPWNGALASVYGDTLPGASAMSKREEDDEAEESTAFARIGQMRLHNREEKRHRLRQNATHNNDGVTDFYRNLLQATLDAGDDAEDIEEVKANLVHRMLHDTTVT